MDPEETVNPYFSHTEKGPDTEEVPPVLLMLSGVLLGRKFILKQEKYTVGRGEEVEIDTRDETVSRQHAEVFKQNGRYAIKDLNSQSGLFVNNCKIDRWILKDGDLVQVGHTIFQFIQSNKKRVFQFGNLKIAV
jgi:pSer/pThr/pTyr-binding forkhead associated (FHA) protein